MTGSTDDRAALACACGAALLWSTVATAFKFSLARMDTFQLLFLSVGVATAALALMLAAGGRWQELRRCRRSDWLRAGLLGLLNPLAYYLILFEAYARLPGQVALAVNYSWPIALMLLSVPLLRQRIGRHDAAAALACYGGILVVCLADAGTALSRPDPPGVLLALLSTLVWAGYWIARTREPVAALPAMFMSFLCALPCTFVACLLFSAPWPLPLAGLAGAVWVGLFEMAVTFLLWLQALRRASSTARVSLVVYLSPFLSLLWLQLVLGEQLRSATLGGLLLIVGGLAWQQFNRLRGT